MTQFVDLHNLSEDARIEMIGHRAVDHKERVAFVVEDDEKADRYVAKLKAKFPSVSVVERFAGPVPGVITVKVAEVQ